MKLPHHHRRRPWRRPRPLLQAVLLAGVLGQVAVLSPIGLGAHPVAASPAQQAPTDSIPSTSGTDDAKATFGVGPSSASGPDGRPGFNYVATPGAALADHLAVTNFANEPVTLSIYAADVLADAEQGADVPPADVAPTAVGTWIAIADHRRATDAPVTVPPRTSVVIPFTFTIPSDASPGDHPAAIVASIQGLATSENGPVINLDQRVVTRVFARVSGVLNPELRVEDLHASYEQNANPIGAGGVTITYTVRNTGNVRLGATDVVQVKGLLGTTKVQALPDLATLNPGGSEHVTTHLDGVWPELLSTAKVTLTPVAPAGDADPLLPPTVASTRIWTIPIALLITIALLILLTWLVRRWRRRRARRGDPSDLPPDALEPTPEPEVVAS